MFKAKLHYIAAGFMFAFASLQGLSGLQPQYQQQDTVVSGKIDPEFERHTRPSEYSQTAQPAESFAETGNCVALQKLLVAPVKAELLKFKQVRMPFNSARLTPRERRMVLKLVEASQYLESIYWRQSDPEGLALYRQNTSCDFRPNKNVRRYLMIYGSRYDFEHKGPLAGAYVPGHTFYSGATKTEIEAYVAGHPEKKGEIYSPFTVVHRQGNDFVGVPYHEEYRQWLEPAAKALREAADLSPDKAFANFLRLRAEALLNDDYYKSDLAWVDLADPKFDVIFAPYETYLDDLLGVKTSYGAAVMIRNEAESRKLGTYQQYVPDIQEALPLASEDKPSKKGHS